MTRGNVSPVGPGKHHRERMGGNGVKKDVPKDALIIKSISGGSISKHSSREVLMLASGSVRSSRRLCSASTRI